MAWIESHQKLERSGKLLLMAEKLGINKYQAIGHLHALWWWALDNARNGDVTRYCNAMVTLTGLREVEMQRYSGGHNVDFTNPEMFIDVLIESGFLDKIGEKITIHGWQEYTHRYFSSVDKYEKNKLKTRQRVQKFRDKKCNDNGNGDVTLKKRDVTPPTKPNLTIPNQTRGLTAQQHSWFEEIWKRYPNKDGRKSAFRSFCGSVKEEGQYRQIHQALDNYLKSRAVVRGFIKNGSTWFNNWQDWINYREVQNDKPKSLIDRLIEREFSSSDSKIHSDNGNAGMGQMSGVPRGMDETEAV